MFFFKVCENLRGACDLVFVTHVIVDRIELGVAGATLLFLSAVLLDFDLFS